MDIKYDNRVLKEITLSIHITKQKVHVLGEKEPRKEPGYLAQILLKDDEENRLTGTLKDETLIQKLNGSKLSIGGLLFIQGKSLEDLFKNISERISLFVNDYKEGEDLLFNSKPISKEEYDAGINGYFRGCEVGKNWGFTESDLYYISMSISDEKYRTEDTLEKLNTSFSKDVFRCILYEHFGLKAPASWKSYQKSSDAANTIMNGPT